MSVLGVVSPQVNKCEQVSTDDHQMSVAWNGSHVSCDHHHQMSVVGVGEVPMSHVWGKQVTKSHVQLGREEGTGVGTVRSNASWVMVTWDPPVKKRTPVKAVVTLR